MLGGAARPRSVSPRDYTEITPRLHRDGRPPLFPPLGAHPGLARGPSPRTGAAGQSQAPLALPLMRPGQVRLTLTRYATECVRELSRYAAKHTDHAAEEVRT